MNILNPQRSSLGEITGILNLKSHRSILRFCGELGTYQQTLRKPLSSSVFKVEGCGHLRAIDM